MPFYKAKHTCYVQGVLLEGNAIISLTDEQEKAERLGKYADEVPDEKALRRDPASKKKVKVGNQNLIKVSDAAIEGREGKPIDEGMIMYPPTHNGVERKASAPDGVHATTFQTTR